MGRQTIWAYLSKVCVGNTVFNRLHVSGDGLRLRVLCINGFKMICCQCEQICSSVNVNVLLTSLAGEMGRKKVESSDESVNLMEVNNRRLRTDHTKCVWHCGWCQSVKMNEWNELKMSLVPTWRLELEVERLMIAELVPSASYKTHAHTHKTHTFRLAG